MENLYDKQTADAIKQEVRMLYRIYASDRTVSPAEALEAIEAEMGQVVFVKYKPNRQLCVSNGIFSVPLPRNGCATERREIEFAFAAYQRAQSNGSLKPGEVHAGKMMSTCHHKQGLEAAVA